MTKLNSLQKFTFYQCNKTIIYRTWSHATLWRFPPFPPGVATQFPWIDIELQQVSFKSIFLTSHLRQLRASPEAIQAATRTRTLMIMILQRRSDWWPETETEVSVYAWAAKLSVSKTGQTNAFRALHKDSWYLDNEVLLRQHRQQLGGKSQGYW